MTHETQAFTVVDPRTFDGDPYEVAERACRQAEAVAHVLATCLETATIMARNAEMSRQEAATGDPKASAWEDSVYGRKFARTHADCKRIERELALLGKAVGYNPKNPPKV